MMKNPRKAFTLVEALVVVAIFSGFLVATLGVFVGAMRSQVSSYSTELEEQTNMRASFELEHLFRSSVGYTLGNLSGIAADQLVTQLPNLVPSSSGNVLSLLVPSSSGNVAWTFFFAPDALGGLTGKLGVYAVGSGSPYYYSEKISLPDGGTTIFNVDEAGRLTYHWQCQGPDGVVDWQGAMVLPK